MKKRGFTLVELLAVIAILAILVIVAMPNVMEMFNSAKADTFVTEVQKYIDTAKTAFVSDAFSNPAETIYYSSVDNPTLGTSKLDMDGNKDYFIEMDRHGNFKRIVIYDMNYCIDIYSNFSSDVVGNLSGTKSRLISKKINKSLINKSLVRDSGNDSVNAVFYGSYYIVTGCELGEDEINVDIESIDIGRAVYNYIPGMTWEEWCNSSYNTDGLYIGNYDNVYFSDGAALARVEGFGTDGIYVSDIIDNTLEYILFE